MTSRDRLIVALDTDSESLALALVAKLRPAANYFKVGSQLFTAAGPGVIRHIVEQGAQVFLDLKFHDIPQTVAHAVAAAAHLKVSMINVHASGGAAMMRAAVESLNKASAGERPRLLAVTMLTSLANPDAAEIGYAHPIPEQVIRLACLAQQAGLDGVVASPLEVHSIRKTCGKDFLIVTPGIRPYDGYHDDQARVATPQAAIEAGADFLVIGRPILEAPDPLQAFLEIAASLKA
ncbi:MAG: orotidine-5'-phosphate decarboxylase [Acidobacteriia bacterium]|nr:orotidine-5'-phosphate decarboxylase [Terriglobia bacterium]